MKLKWICTLAAAFAIAMACTRDKGKIQGPEVHCDAPGTVSFNNNLLPLFAKNCALAGCHAGSAPAGNLNLEPAHAYTELMNPVMGYVDTANPKYSLLYAQMNSVSDPMPPTGKLDQCSIGLVLTWIEQKAKNN